MNGMNGTDGADGLDRSSGREAGCRVRTLYAGRLCRVDLCSHGTVHLNLGDLTIRVGGDDFAELAGALQMAAARIEAGEPAAHPLVC